MLISHSEAQIHQYSIQTPCKVEMAGPCPSLPRSPQEVRDKPSVVARFRGQLCARAGWHWRGWSCHAAQLASAHWPPNPGMAAAQGLPPAHPVPREPLSPPCELQLPLAMPPWSLCLVLYSQRSGVPAEQPPARPWGWFGECPAAPVPQTWHTHNDPVFLATLSCLRGKGKSWAEQGGEESGMLEPCRGQQWFSERIYWTLLAA